MSEAMSWIDKSACVGKFAFRKSCTDDTVGFSLLFSGCLVQIRNKSDGSSRVPV